MSIGSVVDWVEGAALDVGTFSQDAQDFLRQIEGTAEDVQAGVQGAESGARQAVVERRAREGVSGALSNPVVLVAGTAALTLLILRR